MNFLNKGSESRLFIGLFALTVTFLLMFFLIRGVIRLYIDSVLTKRQRKKSKRNEKFVEWFTYKRYLDILPKSQIVWYYLNFVMFITAFVAMIILYALEMQDVNRTILWIYFASNGVWLIMNRINLI